MGNACRRGQKDGSVGRWEMVMNTDISTQKDMYPSMHSLLCCQKSVLWHDWFQIGSTLHDGQNQDMQKLFYRWLSYFFITKHCDLCMFRSEKLICLRHLAVIAEISVLRWSISGGDECNVTGKPKLWVTYR